MSFLYFHFLFLELFLFLGVVCLLVSLLLYYSVMGLIKFLLGSVVVSMYYVVHSSSKVS
jgi:hypothetical protein